MKNSENKSKHSSIKNQKNFDSLDNQQKIISKQKPCNACDSCPGGIHRLGINFSQWDYVLGLAGNPNTGKSTVFNALTGLRQHTGNWPGKTVTRAEGAFQYQTKRYKLVDLPGTYSLLSTSTDEEIARNFILFGQPNCTVVVIDATCLERNLNLVIQVLEITNKVVVALNLMDEAQHKGIEINYRNLSSDLGVPVVPTVAKTGQGITQLLNEIEHIVSGKNIPKPHKIKKNGEFQKIVNSLALMITQTYPDLPNAYWIAMRLLDGDKRIHDALLSDELGLINNRYT